MVISMKTCNKCKIEKPLSDYNKNKNCADGYLTFCKQCNKALRQTLKHDNPEIYARRLARSSRYRCDNVQHTKEAKHEWDIANRDYIKSYNKAKYDADPQSARDRSIQYRIDNPAKAKAANRRYQIAKNDVYIANKRKGHAKRRAAKINATVVWANSKKLNRIYKDAVAISKSTGIMHHVDHIVPLLGKLVCGLHVEYNLQIITAEDNSRKTNSFTV